MNVIYISISSMPDMKQHSISLDLIHEFVRNGHNVYVVCGSERKENKETLLSNEAGCTVLRVKIGNNKKANIFEKGFTTLQLPHLYISAIKKFFADVKFDLILYPTPPITHVNTVRFLKKRDGAKSYLLLKDIFPQNALDIGIMSKKGFKGLLYKYFRKKEKKLYALSDHIGCMSQANVDYLLCHNPEVSSEKVEICPNCIEIQDVHITEKERIELRNKHNIPLDKIVFVYGGNLGKPQGIPFIINCLKEAKEFDNVFFLIVGDGTEYGKLESYVCEEKPRNMLLMKRLPKKEYDLVVAACDVGMIFLDHRFTIPNFPSRLLSYMQIGLPVFACTDPSTDVGKVITEGGFGWWCESAKIDKFKLSIEEIVKCDLRAYGINSINYLHKYYSVKNAYEIIMRFYNKKQ